METEVRYYTRSGNTNKLAEAIAKAVGVEAKTVGEPLTEDVDILFLGSSVYAYGVDDSIKQFIDGIDVKVGKVVNFSTAALVKSTYRRVGKLLATKGIVQAEEEFYCRGSFGPMHKGKPNEKDCMAALAFAKKNHIMINYVYDTDMRSCETMQNDKYSCLMGYHNIGK